MHADGLPSGLFLAICERVGMSGELFAQSRRHGGARHTQKGRRVTRYGHAPARAPARRANSGVALACRPAAARGQSGYRHRTLAV